MQLLHQRRVSCRCCAHWLHEGGDTGAVAPRDAVWQGGPSALVCQHDEPITDFVAYDVDIMPTPHLPTMAVVRALRRLGGDLRSARLKRRLPMRVVAERAGISRATLQRVERGDAGVGAGIYASVLHALGLLGDLDLVADPLRDEVGQARSDAATPRRARLPRAGSP